MPENAVSWQASLRSKSPGWICRPGLNLPRQSSGLFHLVFLRCATMVLIIGSTARYTFFAVETACSMPSITFNTSQSCCFFFVFLRFIFLQFCCVCHAAGFRPISGPFFAFFPTPAGSVRIVELVESPVGTTGNPSYT